MNQQILNEIEDLTQRIEKNTVNLEDYKRYEILLLNSGLTHQFIFSNLKRAGFNTWEEFVLARGNKEKITRDVEANVIGNLIGIGLGILLLNLVLSKK